MQLRQVVASSAICFAFLDKNMETVLNSFVIYANKLIVENVCDLFFHLRTRLKCDARQERLIRFVFFTRHSFSGPTDRVMPQC